MGTTADLAAFVVKSSFADLPHRVVHEAKRDAINVLGCAIYSARDPSLSILLDVFRAEGANPRATIWGTSERFSLQQTALANGYLAHIEDYDDTHFPTVLHPSAPAVPAAFALAEAVNAGGREALLAIAFGVEAACRIAMAVHPWHYDAGWHITGTIGAFGAGVAAGKMLGLDQSKMVACLGVTGTQAAGVREVFGSMTKPFHAGHAAQAGVIAAQLAQRGFTSTEAILEGRRGVVHVMSSDSDLSRVTDALGERWEMFNNGLKPYACGVVNHPLIDACVALRARAGFDVEAIEAIEAEVHPLVPELVGSYPDPKVGLEGKFSVHHCLAIGLLDGAAHPAQFSDEHVRDPRIAALRRKVTLVKNEHFEEEEGVVRLTLRGGLHLEERVEHCTGSPGNPMTDEQLTAKFLALAGETLGADKARALLDRLWQLEEAASISELLTQAAGS